MIPVEIKLKTLKAIVIFLRELIKRWNVIIWKRRNPSSFIFNNT